MDAKEKYSFLSFLHILASTGNIDHAATESGWISPLTQEEKEHTINLSSIPKSHWAEHVCINISLPATIQHFIDTNEKPLTTQEKDAICIALEKLHNTAPEYCVVPCSIIENGFHLIPEA